MSDDVLKIESHGIPFSVRIVREGDRYGLKMGLEHNEADPLVEFYDGRFEERFDKGLGQFVSRYYAKTLLGQDGWSKPSEPGTGLNLQGGVPDWWIDGQAMDQVRAWVSERLEPAPSTPGFGR